MTDNRPDPDVLYSALLNGARLSSLRRLTYRCHAARCLLLDVVDTPVGVLIHQKRYKYSDEQNLQRSSAAGRAANTLDGNNHWRAHSYFIETSALANAERAGRTDVSCDHVLGYPLTAATFWTDWKSDTTEVRVRVDHTRYAV